MLPIRSLITFFSILRHTGAAVLDTFDIEQCNSHIKIALVDTTASLKGYNGEVIPVEEVHGLLTKIHDLMGNAVSKWASNRTCILTLLFNSASWPSSQF